ncbi:MAG: AAA family ATPase [Deltaproteobacteria bacterium]|nr:MAG: AAA family ATPase [Deltaproteobacteria bacterium]
MAPSTHGPAQASGPPLAVPTELRQPPCAAPGEVPQLEARLFFPDYQPVAGFVASCANPTTDALIELLDTAWEGRRPTLLRGPTGCGKTAAVYAAAQARGQQVVRVNCCSRTDGADLLGRQVVGPDQQIVSQDGPVVLAMRRGHVLLLDEINLAPDGVLCCLDGLSDEQPGLLHGGDGSQLLRPHPAFRLFATMNPASSHPDRQQLSARLVARWFNVEAAPFTAADHRLILRRQVGDALPEVLLNQLIAVHMLLAEAAHNNRLGQAEGGIAYTLRDLQAVATRFVHLRGQIDDPSLLAREAWEIYVNGLVSTEDRRCAEGILRVVMPASTGSLMPANLRRRASSAGLMLGDLHWPKLGCHDNSVPTECLVATPATEKLRYWLAKALSFAEPVLLIGGPATGKSGLISDYCAASEQPCIAQSLHPQIDSDDILGGFGLGGWSDGALLTAIRRGATYVADNLDLVDAGVVERLNPLLDARTMCLAEKDAEQVAVPAAFHFVGTMGLPGSDPASSPLSRSLRNRFTCIRVPQLGAAADLAAILRGRRDTGCLPAAWVDLLCEMHSDIAGAYHSGVLGQDLDPPERPPTTLRQLLGAAQLFAARRQHENDDQAFEGAVKLQYGAPVAADREAIAAHARVAVSLARSPTQVAKRRRGG